MQLITTRPRQQEKAEECNVILNSVPEDDPDLQNLDVVDNWKDEKESDIEEVGNSIPQTAGISHIINSSDSMI